MNYLLDKAKKVTGSDGKTAKYLGTQREVVSMIRSGRRNLTPYQAAKLAELIGERWTDHALPVLMEQAKTPAEKDYWQGKLEVLRTLIMPTAKRAGTLAILTSTALLLHFGVINTDYRKGQLDSLYLMLSFRRTVDRLRQWIAHLRKNPASAGFLFARYRSSGNPRQCTHCVYT